MKILGIGVDLVQNIRITNLIKNKKFLDRTYGKKELFFLKKNKDKKNFLAKRFAAKESFAKSLGTGFRDSLNFKDIQILNDQMGKPYFFKSKKIDKIINKRFKTKKYDLFLSISDEKEYSIAFTILQKK